MIKNKICIVGLGYVGLPLAHAFSEKYETVGLDIYQTRIDDLRAEVKEIENIVLNQKSNSLQIKNITKDLERIRVNHAGNVEQAEDDHKAAIKLFNINTDTIGL